MIFEISIVENLGKIGKISEKFWKKSKKTKFRWQSRNFLWIRFPSSWPSWPSRLQRVFWKSDLYLSLCMKTMPAWTKICIVLVAQLLSSLLIVSSACLIFSKKLEQHLKKSPHFSETTRFGSKARKWMFQKAANEVSFAVFVVSFHLLFSFPQTIEQIRAEKCDYVWNSEGRRVLGCPEDLIVKIDFLAGGKRDPVNAFYLDTFATKIFEKSERFYQATSKVSIVQNVTSTWPQFGCFEVFKGFSDICSLFR